LTSSRVELFSIPSPKYIKVADKPIYHSDAVVKKIGVEEIQQKFNFEYFENFLVKKEQIGRDVQLDQNACDVLNRLRNPLNDSLVVCKIDDDIGYGVFTEQPIEMGAVIGIYAGVVNTNAYKDPVYSMSGGEFGIKAIRMGGLMRFIQHMPNCTYKFLEQIEQAENKNELYVIANARAMNNEFKPGNNNETVKKHLMEDYVHNAQKDNENEPIFEQLLKEKARVAESNTSFISFRYKGMKLTIIIATRRIEAKEQLGVSYGFDYWERKGAPYLFNADTGYISEWSTIYKVFFGRNLQSNSDWDWLLTSNRYKVLFSNAIHRGLILNPRLQELNPQDTLNFLDLNQCFLLTKSKAKDLTVYAIKVPINSRRIWISLLQRNYIISFVSIEMTRENIKLCLLSPKLLDLVKKMNIPLEVKAYLLEANEPHEKLSRHPFFNSTIKSDELSTLKINSNQIHLTCQG
jgi:hypothetical protein